MWEQWEQSGNKCGNTLKLYISMVLRYFRSLFPRSHHTFPLIGRNKKIYPFPRSVFFRNSMHKKLVGTVGTWEQTPETVALSQIWRSHIRHFWWEHGPPFVGTPRDLAFPLPSERVNIVPTSVLIAYVCPKCQRHLVDAPRGARVSCPTCHVWVTAPPSPTK